MKKKSINRWIILCFTGIFILSLAISAAANFQENYRSVMSRSDEDMDRCAGVTHRDLAETDLDALILPENRVRYDEIRNSLQYTAGTFGVNGLFVYTIDPETHIRRFYFAVSANLESDRIYRDILFPGAELGDSLDSAEERWLTGEKDVTGSYRDGFQTFWFHGYRGENGGTDYIIALETSVMLERQKILTSFLWDTIPIGLSLLGGLVILLVLVRRRIIRPIAMISDSMSRFAQDGSKKPELLALKSKDEIGQIAQVYNQMTADISTYVGSIENLNREKLEASVELEIARKIQYGLVPEKMTLHNIGFRACAATRPARVIGGDFYDCFQRDEHSVCIVMGDVSGKGTTAAIFMAMAKTMIREKLLAGMNPSKALNQANDELCGQNPEGLFTTVFAAVLNMQTGKLVYANAGHTHPVLLKKTPALLRTDPGIALGLFRDADLKDDSLTLGPVDGILLYTDGVTEAVSPQKQFFGEQRLLETMRSVSDTADAEKILSAVIQAVDSFTEGGEPFDDMASLVLLRVPAESDETAGSAPFRTSAENDRYAIPMALNSFDTVRQAVFRLAGNTQETRMALLACDEALTNIVSYSGATELSFSCEKRGKLLYVSFFDNGIPFDPTTVGADKDFEELDSGGMGLKLIRQTAAGMRYERRRNRNELTLYFNL